MNTPAARWPFLLGVAVSVLAGAAYFYLRPASAEHAERALPGTVLGPRPTKASRYMATLEPVHQPLRVGVTGPWLVTLRGSDGNLARGCSVTLDGRMPAHGHGLPTQPTMTGEPEPGIYVIDGMRLSMPGRWELLLRVGGCGDEDSAAFELEL